MIRLSIAALLLVAGLTFGFFASAAAPASFAGVQPQLTALGNRVYLTFGRGDTLSVARSDDGGDTFAPPVQLPSSGKLLLGMHRGPRVAATNAAVLVTAVAGAKGGGADGDVLLFRSTDLGKSWSQPTVINDVKSVAREGLQALAATPSGLVVVAWLDLRSAGTRVYAAISRDHGATWTPDVLVYASSAGSVCECCHPSIAIDRQNRVAVMFRNSLAGNRDMYVARLQDNGTFAQAMRLGTASWRLDACPMDGGGLAVSDDRVAAVWRREDGVFLTTDAVPERRLGTGRDPAITAADSGLEIVWSTPAGIMLMRGAAGPTALGPGRFPAIVALKDKTLVASEADGRVLVRTISR